MVKLTRFGIIIFSGFIAFMVRYIFLFFLTLKPGLGCCSTTLPLTCALEYAESKTSHLSCLDSSNCLASSTENPVRSGTLNDSPCLVVIRNQLNIKIKTNNEIKMASMIFLKTICWLKYVIIRLNLSCIRIAFFNQDKYK